MGSFVKKIKFLSPFFSLSGGGERLCWGEGTLLFFFNNAPREHGTRGLPMMLIVCF